MKLHTCSTVFLENYNLIVENYCGFPNDRAMLQRWEFIKENKKVRKKKTRKQEKKKENKNSTNKVIKKESFLFHVERYYIPYENLKFLFICI